MVHRKGVTGKMPDQETFFVHYKEQVGTLERNVSSAVPKQIIKGRVLRLPLAAGKKTRRVFIVDSGASFHMVARADLSSKE